MDNFRKLELYFAYLTAIIPFISIAKPRIGEYPVCGRMVAITRSFN